ncbi:MAG: transposase [Planctomycetota bacterium]|nr:transposase [Planctomycetota bacterium]MDA1212323.1 transposase [Planctomycetota bacterium]
MEKKKHLARLEQVWLDHPIVFVTTCTADRRQILANQNMHDICREVWENCKERYRWMVGRYVIMPDHVHFFCAPQADKHKLPAYVGKWKEWTAKYASRRLGFMMPLWQTEFFDHMLRSPDSYEKKWEYVRENPERAGLVADARTWAYQGEIHALRY